MNADYVENIIRNIDKQSYKCILVDGAWGIGKSYMVRKALEVGIAYFSWRENRKRGKRICQSGR